MKKLKSGIAGAETHAQSLEGEIEQDHGPWGLKKVLSVGREGEGMVRDHL